VMGSHRGNVEVIQVIVTRLELRGAGTQNDPCRRITQYWDMEGNLLCEYDINDTLGCNVHGHKLMHGRTSCEHCGAKLDEIVEAAGERLLAERVRGRQ
jgi:hypothetical protein